MTLGDFVNPATVLAVIALILAITAKNRAYRLVEFYPRYPVFYGIWTGSGWMTATENINDNPGVLAIRLRDMWARTTESHNWVVAKIPPDATAPTRDAIALQYGSKPPGLGEFGDVVGISQR